MQLYKEILSEIYNLKKTKRSGWIITGRDLDERETESVSDHSWGACILAMLFLPDSKKEYLKMFKTKKCNDNGYNKNKIITMLVVHDMAEAYTGDVPFGYKTNQDKKKEKARWCYYDSLAKHSPFKNLSTIKKLWDEYEENKSINAKIAKDIDQIESFTQLIMYKEMFVNLKGLDYWNNISEEWINSITIRTNVGKYLFNFLKKYLFG